MATPGRRDPFARVVSERCTGQGIEVRRPEVSVLVQRSRLKGELNEGEIYSRAP